MALNFQLNMNVENEVFTLMFVNLCISHVFGPCLQLSVLYDGRLYNTLKLRFFLGLDCIMTIFQVRIRTRPVDFYLSKREDTLYYNESDFIMSLRIRLTVKQQHDLGQIQFIMLIHVPVYSTHLCRSINNSSCVANTPVFTSTKPTPFIPASATPSNEQNFHLIDL